MRDILRLTQVAVAVMAFFVVAVVVDLRRPPDRGCIGDAPLARNYSVQVEEPVSSEVSTYQLAISHEGRPVDGARVCIDAKMSLMPSMSLSDEAQQVGPGRYEVSIDNRMGGAWKGAALVAEPGRPAVAVPLSFETGLATPAARACDTNAVPDASYSVKLEERARVKVSEYHLAVLQDGRPVSGARVCLAAEMNGMPGMGVANDAAEIVPGRYAVKITLGMPGAWKGTVLIAPPDRPAVTVPIFFIAT